MMEFVSKFCPTHRRLLSKGFVYDIALSSEKHYVFDKKTIPLNVYANLSGKRL
jgi:hypothetical protein